MHNQTLLTDLDAGIANALLQMELAEQPRVQYAGLVRTVFDPGAATKGALTYDSDDEALKGKRFTLDTKNYDVQVAYKQAGAQAVNDEPRWGTGGPTRYNLNLELLLASRFKDLHEFILDEWAYLENLKVVRFSTDEPRILAEGFLFRPSTNTPYDPDLRVYSIAFQYLHGSERFTALTS